MLTVYGGQHCCPKIGEWSRVDRQVPERAQVWWSSRMAPFPYLFPPGNPNLLLPLSQLVIVSFDQSLLLCSLLMINASWFES
jgi:hypothetical protein